MEEQGGTEQIGKAKPGDEIPPERAGETAGGEDSAYQEIQVGDEQIVGPVEIAVG